MTIDINELRRLARAATPGPWGNTDALDPTRINSPYDQVAICYRNSRALANAAFIAAANPAAITELLDRLEAAESDALEQARLNGMGSEREAALMAKLMAKLKAAEKERDDVAQQLVRSEIGKRKISEARDALQAEVGKLKDIEVARCVKINGYVVDNARLAEEVERLRAKIKAMEKQEPVGTLHDDGCFVWRESAPHQSNYAGWKMALYALPGAKGEDK